jgi:hypothetical protein
MANDVVKADGVVSLDHLFVPAASLAGLTAALTREADGTLPIDCQDPKCRAATGRRR